MKIFTITLSILFLITLTACNEETQLIESANKNKQVDAILTKSAEVKKILSDKNILKYETERDKAAFIQSLSLIETAILKLAQNENDRGALQLLYQGIKEIERIPLTKIDNAILRDFLFDIHAYLEKISRQQNVTFDDITWSIFTHDFSDGMPPFASIGSMKEWFTGWSRDRGYATSGGYGNKTDLLTPSFDLTGIRNPGFRIRHSISINQNTGSSDDFDRALILREVFQAWVSTDYVSGDPDLAHWTRVSLLPLPKGADFHTVTSPVIDLTPFIGPNVTIKLTFDMKDSKKYGRHYVTWYLEEFDLVGAGDSIPIKERPKDLYTQLFSKADMSPYKNLSLIKAGATWAPYSFDGVIFSYTKIQSNTKESDCWLISPKIDLRNAAEPILKVSEVVSNPIWEKFSIMISTDYNGGNPNEATWISINRTPTATIAPNKWTDVMTNFDLTPFNDKIIVLAFRYQSTPTDYNGWEIGSVKVMGVGKNLPVIDYKITYNPFPDLVPTPTPVAEIDTAFFNHSFSDNGLTNFTQTILDGTPATWATKSTATASFIRISGFSGKKIGTSLLTSKMIDLTNKKDTEIFVSQALNYYPAAAKPLFLIRIVAAEVANQTFDPKNLNWTDLQFANLPTGADFNVINTEWLRLPENLQKKKIVVGFIYKTTVDYFASWDLYQLKLRATSEEL